MTNDLYPASPIIADKSILLPGASFRRQALIVILSLLLFAIVYLLLVAGAILLAIVCVMLGLFLIKSMAHMIIIIAGAGLIVLGFATLAFLLKFLFSFKKKGQSERIAITEEEQPVLFAFVRKLNAETNTPFPGKIYLSSDVNAGVFYPSSFWSMILPLRKNLEIGLGLVNSVNVSEFKAILAHEFGHFSQRSMKLGSYTYNVNKVIYNMLYDNDGYSSFLNGWASIHAIFAALAMLTVSILKGIQSVLKGIYKLVNKSNLALSREMEFHADVIAASAAGGNNLITGLMKVQVGQGAYNVALERANSNVPANSRVQNIFSNQTTITHQIAKEWDMPLINNLPDVSFELIDTLSKSRVVFKDQWASHPSLAARKANMDRVNLTVTPDPVSAWELFNNREALQEKVTLTLYKSHTGENLNVFTNADFDEQYQQEIERTTIPEIYKGFYDKRLPEYQSWSLPKLSDTPVYGELEDIFTTENGQLYPVIRQLIQDLEIVKAISNKQLDVSSFEFDGIKYKVSQAADIIAQLENELKQKEQQLKDLDQQAYRFFYTRNTAVRGMYIDLLEKYAFYQDFSQSCKKIIEKISPFFQGPQTLMFVSSVVEDLRADLEPVLKEILTRGIAAQVFTNEADQTRIREYIDSNYKYLVAESLQGNEVMNLYQIVRLAAGAFDEWQFQHYRNVLTQQLEIPEIRDMVTQ